MQTRPLCNGLPLVILALSLTLAIPAQAALLDEGNGQLYDNVTNLVWQQNASLAKTNTFGVSGIDANGYMNRGTAYSWIAAMNAANYLGHNNWMLPTTSPVAGGNNWNYNQSNNGTTDFGNNVSSQASQLGYMYYQNLGLKSYYSPTGVFQTNAGIFGNGTGGVGVQGSVGLVNNLQTYFYWSSTSYAPLQNYYPSSWVLDFNGGAQVYVDNLSPAAAWVVRAGTAADIAATVPEPESYAMLLAGLGLVGMIIQRNRRIPT